MRPRLTLHAAGSAVTVSKEHEKETAPSSSQTPSLTACNKSIRNETIKDPKRNDTGSSLVVTGNNV